MRTIGVVTVARSDFGIYRPLLRRIEADGELHLLLFVGGTHFADVHGATVAEIARRWGWASPAQFATAYRKRYGMPPSHTLRG